MYCLQQGQRKFSSRKNRDCRSNIDEIMRFYDIGLMSRKRPILLVNMWKYLSVGNEMVELFSSSVFNDIQLLLNLIFELCATN